MRKKIAVILCCTFLAGLVTGCGALAADDESIQKTMNQQTKETQMPNTEDTEKVNLPVDGDGTEPESTAKPTATEEAKLESPIEIDSSIPIERGAKISVIAKATTGDYWKNIKKGMEDAVKYLNQLYGFKGEDAIAMTFEGPASEDDVSTQINTIDSVLSENPDVLCLAALDRKSCQAQLETAKENGIPVILFDSGVKSASDDLITTFCTINNTKAGAEAADKLAESMGEAGKVTIAAHYKYTETSMKRVAGFSSRLNKKYPNMALQGVVYQEKEQDLAEELKKLLDGDKDIGGIFCTNQEIAENVLSLLEDYPDRDIRVVGFDSGELQIEAVKNGKEVGTVAQNPYLMGFQTMWAAAQATSPENREEKSGEQIVLDYQWVDSTNIESIKTADYLYK